MRKYGIGKGPRDKGINKLERNLLISIILIVLIIYFKIILKKMDGVSATVPWDPYPLRSHTNAGLYYPLIPTVKLNERC